MLLIGRSQIDRLPGKLPVVLDSEPAACTSLSKDTRLYFTDGESGVEGVPREIRGARCDVARQMVSLGLDYGVRQLVTCIEVIDGRWRKGFCRIAKHRD